MIKSVSNIVEMAKGWSTKDLEAIKYMLFFFIVVDLGFVHWYLKLKKLSIALLLVLMMCLVAILILENYKKGGPKMKQEEEAQDLGNGMEKKNDEDTQSFSFFQDLGLPNAEEFEKRMMDALA